MLPLHFSRQFPTSSRNPSRVLRCFGRPFTYTYATNANLVAQIASPTGLITTKSYDNLGRLTSTVGKKADDSAIASFSYTYDAAGQRDTETAADATRTFGYDAYRQLTQAVTTSGATETARHTYSFDGIGNRLTSASGNSLVAPLETTYTTNPVNQYTALLASGASTPDTYTYDANGNTTAQPGQTLRYDEENRLIEAINGLDRCLYTYDGFGRRVEKLTYTGSTPSGLVRYVYDGWRVMEELDENFATVRSYTLGLDLSGTPEGAGGIGGLLAIAKPSGTTYTAATYYYDGNGNVTDLAAADGSNLAHYTYSPFGERLAATGTWADINPYQFSSKPRETINGLYYYGLRYYNPGTGRWLSRDPIEEWGGLNLYGMVGNDLLNQVDVLGLASREDILKAFCKLSPCAQQDFLKNLGKKTIQPIKNGKRHGQYTDENGLRHTVDLGDYNGTTDHDTQTIYIDFNKLNPDTSLSAVYHESYHADHDIIILGMNPSLNRDQMERIAENVRFGNEIKAYTAESNFALMAGLSNPFIRGGTITILGKQFGRPKAVDTGDIKDFVHDKYKYITKDENGIEVRETVPTKEEDGLPLMAADFKCH